MTSRVLRAQMIFVLLAIASSDQSEYLLNPSCQERCDEAVENFYAGQITTSSDAGYFEPLPAVLLPYRRMDNVYGEYEHHQQEKNHRTEKSIEVASVVNIVDQEWLIDETTY